MTTALEQFRYHMRWALAIVDHKIDTYGGEVPCPPSPPPPPPTGDA